MDVNTESPEMMVRTVCDSFAGGDFSLYQAAVRMVEMYPRAPRETFSEGWSALVESGQIRSDGAGFRMAIPSNVLGREDSQAPGCG